MQPTSPAAPQSRVRIIDGLRGVAALMVVAGHVCGFSQAPSAALAFFRNHVSSWGFLGVPIFFVISGFVIANSLRDAKITPLFCAQYALRRSIRLDPPCWFAIVASCAFGYWAGWPTDGGVGAAPTVKLVLAHLFYLQGLLYCPNLSPVLWTLCLELQFYATYLLLLGLAQRLKISVFWPVFALGFLSLCFSVSGGYSKQYLPLIIDAHRSLLPMFSMFAIGIVLWLHHARLIPLLLCALWIGFVCLRMKLWFQYYMFGALIAGFIIFVGLRRKLVVIENPLVLFLGRISYSLYLIHYPVAQTLIALANKFTGRHVENGLPFCLFAIGLSILAAWGMNVLIEQPALRLSKRVAPRREREKESPVPVAPQPALESPA
jgi:peptidoglycan/LPS O-acetylase OafA/YrhL